MAKKWSGKVTETSRALDLEKGVFTFKSPKAIAKSLANSAEKSSNKKTTAFRSAMSMLNFYINRAGSNLSSTRKAILEKAKNELRKIYGKPLQHG